MSWIGHEIVRESLEELSRKELQEKLWFSDGSQGQDVSSFTEAVERLFTDSGLEGALEGGGTGYSADVEDKLRSLSGILSNIDGKRSPGEVMNDPLMSEVRSTAANILKMIEK